MKEPRGSSRSETGHLRCTFPGARFLLKLEACAPFPGGGQRRLGTAAREAASWAGGILSGRPGLLQATARLSPPQVLEASARPCFPEPPPSFSEASRRQEAVLGGQPTEFLLPELSVSGVGDTASPCEYTCTRTMSDP